MTQARQPSTPERAVSGIKGRLTDLERQLGIDVRNYRPDTLFTLGGPLYVSESSPYPVPSKRRYKRVAMALTVAGSSTTTAQVKVNGAGVGSFSLPAGQAYSDNTLSLLVEPGDLVTVALTTAGDDAEGLTVQLTT